MANTTPTVRSAEVADAEKLAAAVAEVQILAVRFRAEGQDEMFLVTLERFVQSWGEVAERERL